MFYNFGARFWYGELGFIVLLKHFSHIGLVCGSCMHMHIYYFAGVFIINENLGSPKSLFLHDIQAILEIKPFNIFHFIERNN